MDSIRKGINNLSTNRIFSGAGHDAQMFAPHCPTAMIFVPSDKGISHNINEYTSPEQVANGANVLLQTVLELAYQIKGVYQMSRMLTVGVAQLGPIARSESRAEVVARMIALLTQAMRKGVNL